MTVPTERVVADRARGERCCNGEARPQTTADEADRLAAAFDIFAHPVRVQLLDVIARNEGRVCVCDLEAAVPVKQPTVSHHLKLLRKAGIVASERRGVWAYYYVDREALAERAAEVAAFLHSISA